VEGDVHPDVPLAPAQVGAYILAGGRSRRMGRDKHRLSLDGAPLARVLAAMAAPHVAHVWLVGKRDTGLENLGLPVLYDAHPETALVCGIRAALQAPGPEWRWLLACDMPGVDAAVLGDLWRAARAASALGAVPALSAPGEIEPLPSLWHRDTAAIVAASGVTAARTWVERAGLAVWVVPPARHDTFANLNTPEEWDAWRCRHDAGHD
jgi:molybdopterin-guanine dinucleotide biosynthesis protein A